MLDIQFRSLLGGNRSYTFVLDNGKHIVFKDSYSTVLQEKWSS